MQSLRYFKKILIFYTSRFTFIITHLMIEEKQNVLTSKIWTISKWSKKTSLTQHQRNVSNYFFKYELIASLRFYLYHFLCEIFWAKCDEFTMICSRYKWCFYTAETFDNSQWRLFKERVYLNVEYVLLENITRSCNDEWNCCRISKEV